MSVVPVEEGNVRHAPRQSLAGRGRETSLRVLASRPSNPPCIFTGCSAHRCRCADSSGRIYAGTPCSPTSEFGMEAIGTEDTAKPEFTAFFRQTYPRVVGFLLTLGGDRQDAEDAAQEAFVHAYRTWDSIKQPQAWVRTVALRAQMRNFQRDRRAWNLPDEFDSSISDVTESALEQQKVLQLLRSLPSRQRVTLALYYDGLSLSEIADILQVSRGTVGVHLHRARQQLRDLLAEDRGSTATNGTEAAR